MTGRETLRSTRRRRACESKLCILGPGCERLENMSCVFVGPPPPLPARPLSPHYQLRKFPVLGVCFVWRTRSSWTGHVLAHWHSSGTLCLAVTLYLSENNNTLSVISATWHSTCVQLQLKNCGFAACERDEENSYRPSIDWGHWPLRVTLRLSQDLLINSEYVLPIFVVLTVGHAQKGSDAIYWKSFGV